MKEGEEEGEVMEERERDPDQKLSADIVIAKSFPLPKNETERIELLQEKDSFQRFLQHPFLVEITKLAASYFNVSQ